MSEHTLEKRTSHLSPGYRYLWKQYHARLHVGSIVIQSRRWGKKSLHDHLALLEKEKEKSTRRHYDFRDVMIFPSRFHQNKVNDILFVIVYRGITMSVRAKDIVNLQQFEYWCGCRDEKELALQLHHTSTRWTLHRPTDSKDDAFISVRGERQVTPLDRDDKSYNGARMLPFGWFDILPSDIVQEAKKNGWRTMILNPGKGTTIREGTREAAELYANPQCATLLMNLPVAFYEVSKNSVRKVKETSIDIRSLKKLAMLYQQSHYDHGDDEGCQDNLDLFDAMMASGVLWTVDKSRDVLYLPVLSRPPNKGTQDGLVLLNTETMDDKVTQKQPSCLSLIYPDLDKDSIHRVLRYTFPFETCTREVHKNELFNRIRGKDNWCRFKPGVCITIEKQLYVIMPRGVCG